MTPDYRPGLVSVVIPTYNAEDTLEETLTSVEGQEDVSLEALIVDDGSTDLTLEIASRWSRRCSRFRVLRHPGGAHLGVAASRNLGVRFASGEYVAFIDADDVWEAGALRKLRQAIQACPVAALAYGRASLFGGSQDTSATIGYGTPGVPVDLFPVLCRSNPIVLSATLVRARCLPSEGAGPFPEGLPFQFEDWALWLRLARSFPFVFVDERVTRYRLSPQSATSRMTRGDCRRRFHWSQAELLLRLLEREERTRRAAIGRALVYRSCDALREGASRFRRGRLRDGVSWLVTAWRIAASPWRLARAVCLLPFEQARVQSGRPPFRSARPWRT